MKRDKRDHILGTASNLLGICFILITGMRLSHTNLTTYADEITLAASIFFLSSCIASYLSLREDEDALAAGLETWADRLFLCGLCSLFSAVSIFSTGII